MASIKKNFMYQTAWQIMQMILPLITSPILARTLGAEGLGTYSYISSIVGYFVLVANLGMYKYGIREIAAVRDDREKLSRVFWEIWKLHSLLAVFIGVIYIVFALFFSDYAIYFMLMLALYIGNVININWLFVGVEDFKKIAIRDMTVKLVTFVLIVIFIRSKESLPLYIIINAVGSLISNIIYWVMYGRYVKKIKVSIKETFYHGKAMCILFIPILLESLYTSMDKVMLGYMCEKSEVGYYENADKALIAKTIIYSITTVLMPRMANLLAKKDYDKFNKLMKDSTGIILILSSAFAFGTAAIAKEFSVIFWGSDFIRSAGLIMILALAMPAIVLSREIREQYLIPASKDKEYLLSAGIGAMANMIINILLIPQFGAIGAAIATVISEYLVLITQMIVIKEELYMYKYIHGNEIYFIFGIVMFVIVRNIGKLLGVHIYTIIVEILVGVMIYTVSCMIYWIISKQSYYLGMIKRLLSRR